MTDYEKNEELMELEEIDEEGELSRGEAIKATIFLTTVGVATVYGFVGLGKQAYKKGIKPLYKKVRGAIIRKKAFESNKADIIDFKNDEIIISKEEDENNNEEEK